MAQPSKKTCPRCGVPLLEGQTSCGAGPCRQYVYRKNKKERLDRERKATRDAVRQYCARHLPPELGAVVQMATELLIGEEEEGYQQARKLIEAIELQRCKHEKIQILIYNAQAAKQRAKHAEEAYEGLKAHYDKVITDLQADIQIYQANENAIHRIAQQQLEQQPER